MPYGDTAKAESIATPTSQSKANIHIDFNNKTIACIDDDPQQLKAMADLLTKWNCKVLSYTSYGEISRSTHELMSIDFLITDYHLEGGYTGVDSIQLMQKTVSHSVPALIVSADSSENVIKQLRADGHLFLSKPLKPLKLYNLLKKYL